MPPPALARMLWTPPPAGLALSNKLSGYWELNEATGSGNRVDGSANALNLTASASITAVAGIISNACSFSGANKASHVDDPLLRGDGAWTLALWVSPPNQTGSAYMACKGSLAGTHEFLVLRVGSGYSLQIQNNTKSCSLAGAATIDTWRFLVARYSLADQKIYLQIDDGTLAQTALAGVSISGTANDFTLGEAGGSAGQPVKVDQVGFWQRELSAVDRTWLYGGGAGRTAAEVLARIGVP